MLLLKTWFNRARFQAGRRDEEQYVLYPLVRGKPLIPTERARQEEVSDIFLRKIETNL